MSVNGLTDGKEVVWMNASSTKMISLLRFRALKQQQSYPRMLNSKTETFGESLMTLTSKPWTHDASKSSWWSITRSPRQHRTLKSSSKIKKRLRSDTLCVPQQNRFKIILAGLRKYARRRFLLSLRGGVELSNWQKRVFTEAVRHGTRFFVVDASSSDRAPIVHSWSEDYNIRGVARHIGGRIAYRRSTESVVGDDSVIDFIDADCGMPTSYFKAVSESAQKNRTISAFVKELVTYAPNIPDWPHLDPLHRVAHLFHFLRRNITVRRERYLADSDTNPVGHGPSIAVRAKLFASINGYPRKYLNEDFQLRRSISARGEKFGRIDGTHVRLSDRDAPTSIDGKSAAPGISSEFSDSADSFAHYFDPHNLKTLEGHTEYLSFAKTTLRTDKDYSAHAGYRDLRAKRWKEEVALSKKRVLTLRKTVVALVKVLEKVLVKPRWETYSDPRLLRGWLEKHIGGTVDDYVIDWLVENPIIVASVVNVARMMRDDDQRDTLGIEKQASLTEMVWSFFKKYLPEYFTPLPEDEPDYEVLRASVEEGTMPEGHSLNSITHLVRATSEWRRSRT